MPRLRVGLLRDCKRMAAVGVLASLVVAGGCKTQADAAAAAAQMAKTAQTLVAYYAALDHVLAQTQDSYQAQYALQQTPVRDVTATRKQIQLREEMATEMVSLSGLFAKVTGSTAAADASTAGGKLNKELVGVAGMKANSDETTAVTEGIKEVVALLEQHDEVKAAKKMAPLCHALAVFFDSEKEAYDVVNQSYLMTAQSVAQQMVKTDQVDTSGVFRSALAPFGLAPAVDPAKYRANLQPYLLGQIDAAYPLQLAAGQKATAELSKALHEMDTRVALVAGDKPMKVRLPPLSLATVETWTTTTEAKK